MPMLLLYYCMYVHCTVEEDDDKTDSKHVQFSENVTCIEYKPDSSTTYNEESNPSSTTERMRSRHKDTVRNTPNTTTKGSRRVTDTADRKGGSKPRLVKVMIRDLPTVHHVQYDASNN